MYENVDSVCSEVKHLLDHISLLGGSVSGSRMRPCLLTSQTAPDLWSMTSSTPCLDWTPSGLLNCYCHNPFRTAQQNKAFVATFKSRGRVKYWDTSVSVSVLSGSWSDRIRRSSTLQVWGSTGSRFMSSSCHCAARKLMETTVWWSRPGIQRTGTTGQMESSCWTLLIGIFLVVKTS